MTRLALLTAAALSMPAMAFAAGTAPPKTTQTAADCAAGQVFDERTKACVAAQDSRLTDPDRIEAAYELAHAGRADEALVILAYHSDPTHPDVLTLRGFATRIAGDWDAGIALYDAALAQDPDHWLARSYLGSGLAARGQMDEAKEQLRLIRASGGRGSYPEQQLAMMIETGRSNY